MAIQLGKYLNNRPDIYLNEIDSSQISISPTVDGITNTVIGASKRGPVNTFVELNNITDLENIFGKIDRSLERRGSYFHRTIAKMLESSPVYAINLLKTDDELDTVEYKNLSTSSSEINDVKRTGPYRRIFDTTGFWERDEDTFQNLVDENAGSSERLLTFTNLSDKKVTIFIFKSNRTGFDIPVTNFYGTLDEVPEYINNKDLASDYLVDVLVVRGDYSNYRDLSVDNRFSAYFNPNGLRKNQLRNFSNDRNVNTLAFAEGLSLIPFFRDLDGNNIFIETAINAGTDEHGVFCTFNEDAFETEYTNGLVDLIGNNLVRDELNVNPPTSDETVYDSLDANDGVMDGQVQIDFLSYNETITETLGFTEKVLDRPGNVMALFSTASLPSDSPFNHSYLNSDMSGVKGGVENGNYIESTERTFYFSEGYINDLYASTYSQTSGTISITYEVNSTSNNGYAVIGGQKVDLGTQSNLTISPSDYAFSTGTQSYRAAFTIDSTGSIKKYITSVAETKPKVGANDLVLGYASFSVASASFVGSLELNDVYLKHDISLNSGGDDAYNPLVYGTDYEYNSISSDSFKVEFLNTNQSIGTEDYEEYRRIKTYNLLLDYINSSTSDRGVLLADPFNNDGEGTGKISLSFVEVDNVANSTSSNKSFVINTSIPTTDPSENSVVEDGYVDNYFANDTDVVSIASSQKPLVFYKVDDELVLGKKGLDTKSRAATTDIGVAGKYSTLYSNYENGLISTGDVIYQKTNYVPLTIDFVQGESISATLSGYDYLVFGVDETYESDFGVETDLINSTKAYFEEINSSLLSGYEFVITGVDNEGVFTTKTDEGLSSISTANQRASELGFTNSTTYSYYGFEVNENVTTETLSNVTNLFAYNDDNNDGPLYIEADFDNELNLKLRFKDKLLSSEKSFDSIDASTGNALDSNHTFYVNSFDSNYRQTIEIEEPSGYTVEPNKILVRASRYTEVNTGDYLKASYATASLESNEMPRKLTRILSKRLYSADNTLVEITCDSEIEKTTIGSTNQKQTTRYTTIDDYVSTYKAITLKEFKIRDESLPDGTEDKQEEILNLVAKGTPLFKAITNKDAFDFRYLVDSFGLGLTERSKQQLLDICGERLDCFGFINVPSIKMFKESSSPTFTDDEGNIDYELIAKGGDEDSSPAFLYSFGDGDGATSVGYFFPYITINDSGRQRNVPPAPFVATTYMRKHNSVNSNIVPWTIAAGISDGRITNISGLEKDIDNEGISALHNAKFNPIVFKRNRGNIIQTENTALTSYRSALSFIHVREVLIELERELSDMLLEYHWKLNTPEARAEIKLRADIICESYVARNGLYDYFNKMDEENNTQTIIDNQAGVLDTYVEPIKGMGYIINNVNILRTGAIQSGGFIQN